MTIAVQVTHCDAKSDRPIEVIEILDTREGEANRVQRPQATRIEPGESRTFYVHLLKDLQVREVNPG